MRPNMRSFNIFYYFCGQNRDNEKTITILMKAKKVLFITQEITPYVPESEMSVRGRKLPQLIQDQGCEIRTFMPRWGNINERRNQLHEVIRLSGMNIIIDETDNPLIIKVASLQAARMQVYFIDNDDFFLKRGMRTDDQGVEYADNAQRAVFYARGVLETMKKLRWSPDVVHCHGWISSIVPLYLKTAYKEEPSFVNSKVIFTGFSEQISTRLPENFLNCVKFKDASDEVLAQTGIDFSKPEALSQLAIKFSDGFVEGSAENIASLSDYARANNLPVLPFGDGEPKPEMFAEFYDKIF